MAQTASMQSSGQRPQQGQANNTNFNNNQSRANNQPQTAKSLKRPNSDEAADTSTTSNVVASAAAPPPPPPRPASHANQLPKGVPTLSPSQLSSLNPEQRAKYEQLLKLQGTANFMQQPSADALNRLRAISLEEQRQFNQEAMPEIPMSSQERMDTSVKLQRIALDMNKVSRGLTKWYSITGDDARAKMFFRTVSRSNGNIFANHFYFLCLSLLPLLVPGCTTCELGSLCFPSFPSFTFSVFFIFTVNLSCD